jgi:hypothetical protein
LLLPLLSLAAFGIAVWVSLWRRRTLLQIGVGAAITMALSLLVLRLARSQVLDQVANALYQAAAEAVWDIVLRGLVVQTVVVLLVGVIMAVVAFLAGPNPRAVAVRGSAQDFLGNEG